ncbi:MAG: ion transporter [Gammaproteobacteria bacterium]|uniref:potassium channel family protein n=1 Tax=Rhodoferax sp. TaxID=50421 RepID=UPI0017C4B167|nr:ion transporter [Rhodoferax sp.]MBU3899637.1 ion transporter [Gammaproteobacteria bacterium]MBA3056564.1 ion transporter [Rhodoferax sp.]MBU3998968.1 ion transporter [Gammaproteobacteria bacterium]MBU4018113.1 ion transporter [Gammaproteobacteria bacterium]MBU4080196.1 ion transporter [Gammaproteobacteria bacterium]
MSNEGTNKNPGPESTDANELKRERYELLQRLDGWLETPMLVLAFVWLVLLIVELVRGESLLFYFLGTAIWIVFIVDFAVKLVLAPDKLLYLKSNWLTAIALLLPALRIFRVFRAFRLLRLARTGRGLRLVRVVSSMNRGMKALGASLSRRGFGYVITLTVLVTFAGAAGMYAFENESPGGLGSYVDALWWTAMIMATMGSGYWPQTAEGRVLCVFLALYAFGIFGYVTAALATFFVGRDADNIDAELAGAKQLAEVRDELIAIRDEIRALSRQSSGL